MSTKETKKSIIHAGRIAVEELIKVAKEPIVEYNLLFFKPGKTRGFHYHPHFIEYLLCVDGNGVLVTRKKKNDNRY